VGTIVQLPQPAGIAVSNKLTGNFISIELHTWDTPNGRKITVALEEMGLPYSIHPVNISKDEQFKPEFLAISPNNKIPAIVDTDGPGGQQVSVFESGAILMYMAEKTGKFLPTSGAARVSVMEWLMFQMGGFGPAPGQVHHFIALENENDRAYGLARFDTETRRLYGVMDKRLGEVEFFAGDLSIADFAIIGWAWRHPRHKVDLAEYPNVKRWYDQMMTRPATMRGFEVDVKTARA
jgi:GSH-dependent disulfide-bond oxidoreductase